MRVLVVEDHAFFLLGLVTALTGHGHEVVTAGEPYQAEKLLGERRPDVAVVDIKLPPTHSDEGLRLAALLRSHEVPVLVLSQYAVPEYAISLLGADPRGRGYLLKERVAGVAQFMGALDRVAAGGTVIDTELAAMVTRAAARRAVLSPLSERELEILALVTEGLTDRGIAERLVISVHTVVTHVQSVFRKLDLPKTPADNRRVLAALAYLRNG
ncbi:DNA-binding response regulator [Acrocarpospora phusangensis]|uniref:DNA-binding response regulator n=1 Tax=Acrocarpospora phusangensis TaxID=1070424 RepID=A0A919UJU0_9ACTN|nr:response regulator transcription factor [Acrocarpospora phusangensis]GIH24379.1 DNA-binding response regulator [Acrocarpospora phusangensis]